MTKTIMVVDDEKIILEGIQLLLEMKDYDVFAIDNGHECLEKIKTIDPDLLLLDILMPEMNGWEVLSNLAVMKLDIPVIILTAKIQTIDKVIGRNNPLVREYITKPFNNHYLLEKIKEIVEE